MAIIEQLDDDDNQQQQEEELTALVSRQMTQSQRLKDQGNDQFRSDRFDDAVRFYLLALDEIESFVPPPPPRPPSATSDQKGEEEHKAAEEEKENSTSNEHESSQPQQQQEQTTEPSPLSQPEIPPQLAQDLIDLYCALRSNIAAARLKLQDYQATISECNLVLAYQPNHIKALFRRSSAFEATEKFDEALVDMEQLVKLVPSSDSSASQYAEAVKRITLKRDEKRKREMDEMLGASLYLMLTHTHTHTRSL